jgi:hypothetical protein
MLSRISRSPPFIESIVADKTLEPRGMKTKKQESGYIQDPYHYLRNYIVLAMQ